MTIKILVDEHSENLMDYLIDLGYSVMSAKEIEYEEGTAKDPQLLKYVEDNKYILVTKDKKLANHCRERGLPCIDLGSPKEEANHVHEVIQRMLIWKEYI